MKNLLLNSVLAVLLALVVFGCADDADETSPAETQSVQKEDAASPDAMPMHKPDSEGMMDSESMPMPEQGSEDKKDTDSAPKDEAGSATHEEPGSATQ